MKMNRLSLLSTLLVLASLAAGPAFAAERVVELDLDATALQDADGRLHRRVERDADRGAVALERDGQDSGAAAQGPPLADASTSIITAAEKTASADGTATV